MDQAASPRSIPLLMFARSSIRPCGPRCTIPCCATTPGSSSDSRDCRQKSRKRRQIAPPCCAVPSVTGSFSRREPRNSNDRANQNWRERREILFQTLILSFHSCFLNISINFALFFIIRHLIKVCKHFFKLVMLKRTILLS